MYAVEVDGNPEVYPMAKRPVKLVLRSNPVIMAIVLAAVIIATVATVCLQNSLEDSRSQYEAMRLQAAALEAANEELISDISDLGSVESAIKIAEEELGLVCPDTVVFTPAID